MTTKAITLEVQQNGQKPRLFRLEKDEISIGFSPRCHVFLEPQASDGPELLLINQSGTKTILRPTCQPGAFQINGAPCLDEVAVKPGDVISADSCRVTLRTLPPDPAASPSGSDEQNEDVTKTGAAATFAAKTAAEVPTAKEQHEAPAKKAKPGLSYLYLFFAPVQEFLLDDDVAEIMINGPKQIFIERKGKLAAIPAQFSSEQALQAAVMNVARSVGRFFDRDNPRLDARLPDGSRVHAVMPPLSRAGTIVAIRKFRREKMTIKNLIQYGSLSSEAARLLEMTVGIGRNLIVSGATSSGKTSVLNVLSALIPEHDRILVLEDASELQLQQPHVVCFETRKADEHGKGEITIRDLLHSALRLRPDRLVVGEIRGGEALDLLQAMNTGHEGSMSTIHANTARDSLLRMETCALLSGIEIPLSALRQQVASAIQMVLQTARLHDGTRKITAITEVLGLKGGEYELQDIVIFQQEGMTSDGRIEGRHVFTGYQPTFLKAAKQRGFDVEGLFSS